MRAVIPLHIAVSAATLLAGCTATGPGPSSESEILVLAVRPSSASIDGGAFVQLTASIPGDEALVTTPLDIGWSSADPTIARVGADGLVEGRRAGEVRINANWKNAHGSALVKVARSQKPAPDDAPCLKRLPVPVKSIVPDTECR
jgi:hypothetical protein